jgi:hypothetical protein
VDPQKEINSYPEAGPIDGETFEEELGASFPLESPRTINQRETRYSTRGKVA